ncbi:MAG: hypothetical protein IJU52_02810 [Clostridia bacterium]|nr:hypothetical protein [Clostridia bacterium]
MRKGCSILLALLCVLFCACGHTEEKRIDSDPDVLTRRLNAAGYTVRSFDAGSALLSALEDEMNETLDEPAEKALKGYLCANDGLTGELALELFVFEDARDAENLFGHLKDNGSFVDGVSEIRLDGKVVYMGLITALDTVERAPS